MTSQAEKAVETTKAKKKRAARLRTPRFKDPFKFARYGKYTGSNALKGTPRRRATAPVPPDDPSAPKKRTHPGPNKGHTKAMKPKLANRLPRERGGLIARVGDGLTPFERALQRLGPRVTATKTYYLLDGIPCNASDIMTLAESLK